ncbi:MAG: hypothetical protein JO064_06025 [Actinobacteria bacterium]|nr:hypothetical protein [Actinomycetota bacterium]
MRRHVNLLVLVAYCAASFAYFGWRLPHPGRLEIGIYHDPELFVWSFGWWEHALATFTNPFVSHALYAPSGINLTWTPTAAGLALVFSPLTAAFGAVASYNVAAVLLPALAAWTAYLLCHHVTGSVWASAVGGYLFGFSSGILGQQISGHLHQTGVFLVPLVALVVLRYVEGGLSERGFVWRLAIVVAAQLWISTEIALTTTILLVLGIALGALLVPAVRARLRAIVLPTCVAYVLGAVVAGPFVLYALKGFHAGEIVNGNGPGADLLDLAVPTPTVVGGTWFTSVSSHFSSLTSSAYLGLPTLAVVALYARRARRSACARFLLASLGVTVLIVLGVDLRVDGHRLFALPWALVMRVPVLKNALAFRFAIYVGLAAGVIVAMWTATTRGRVYPRPYLLPVLAVLALVPAVWRSAYPSFKPQHPDRYPFFTSHEYETCVRRGSTLAVFPFGGAGHDLLYQVESGFWFDLADNGLAPVPRNAKPLTSFDADPVVSTLSLIDFARPTADSLLAFASLHHVARFVVVPGSGYPTRRDLAQIGPTELRGGVLVSPACNAPPLTARNLTRYVQKQASSHGSIGYCTGPNFNLLPAGTYPAGPIAGAVPAHYVVGQGVTCAPPPSGYKRRGLAPASLGVPANTYPYYAP